MSTTTARTMPAVFATTAPEARVERTSRWLLRGPLAWAIALLCLAELAVWAPHYLTWPFFADHDVFASMAHAWDAGELPYRDTLGNNFPGTTYFFWVLGKVFGWSCTAAFYALDAAFVGLLGLVLWAWSRRRFGRALPGLIAYLAFLAYYLSLDYSQAAQRDWQGPCFAVVSLLIAEAWPGHAGRICSALALAVGFSIRPQVVLFGPAILCALDGSSRGEGGPWTTTARAILEWGAALAVFVALAFAPLMLAGVLPDFVRSVRLVAYGAGYNQTSVFSIAKGCLREFGTPRFSVTIAALILLGFQTRGALRRTVVTWLVATLFVLLYRPLSPRAHAYLDHPLRLVWSIDLAVLAQVLLECAPEALGSSASKLAAVLLVLGLGAPARPKFCAPAASVEAIKTLRAGIEPVEPPLGYAHNPAVGRSAIYDWSDLRAVTEYLRKQTSHTTRVANALRGLPALVGPTGRLSAFPAESIAWLHMVHINDEPKFIAALERTPDSVVVWAPGEDKLDPTLRLEALPATIRKLYEPAERFGTIEVWKRKPGH